jgi:hypothetical protein
MSRLIWGLLINFMDFSISRATLRDGTEASSLELRVSEEGAGVSQQPRQGPINPHGQSPLRARAPPISRPSGQLCGQNRSAWSVCQRTYADHPRTPLRPVWLWAAKVPCLRDLAKRGTEESNLELGFWRPTCCHYTSPPWPYAPDSPDRVRPGANRQGTGILGARGCRAARARLIVLARGLAILRGAALPKWLGWVAIALGLSR